MIEHNIYDPVVETRPVEDQFALDRESYREQVKYLFAHSEFYQRKFAEAGFHTPEQVGELDDIAALPFTEKDGQFWGAPADDAAAIAELERLRREKNASLLVFLWENFWELEHYTGFARHLAANYERVINNEHFIAFDVAAPVVPQRAATGG